MERLEATLKKAPLAYCGKHGYFVATRQEDEDSCPICDLERVVESERDPLRDEMKAIALAIGRSKTDGESDCDWFDLTGDVARLKKIETAAKAIAENAEEIEFNDAMGFAAGLDCLSDLNTALDEDKCDEQ